MGEAHLLFIARAGVFVTDRFKKQPTEHQPVSSFSVTFLSILLLHSDQLSFYDQAQVVLPFQDVVTVTGYDQEAFAIDISCLKKGTVRERILIDKRFLTL